MRSEGRQKYLEFRKVSAAEGFHLLEKEVENPWLEWEGPDEAHLLEAQLCCGSL